MSDAPVMIVVPCFDEADRLDPDGLRQLACLAGAGIHLVDDGSTDGTAAVLAALVAADPGGKPVTDVPGLSPRSPLTVVGPVFVPSSTRREPRSFRRWPAIPAAWPLSRSRSVA